MGEHCDVNLKVCTGRERAPVDRIKKSRDGMVKHLVLGLSKNSMRLLLPADSVRNCALGGARNKAIAGLGVQRGGRFYRRLDRPVDGGFHNRCHRINMLGL